MGDQYEHARTHSAESYESGSGPSSQASTVPGGNAYNNQHAGGRPAYDDYSQDELVRQPQSALVYPCLSAYTAAVSALCFQNSNRLEPDTTLLCILQDSRQPSFINKKGGDNVGTLAR